MWLGEDASIRPRDPLAPSMTPVCVLLELREERRSEQSGTHCVVCSRNFQLVGLVRLPLILMWPWVG